MTRRQALQLTAAVAVAPQIAVAPIEPTFECSCDGGVTWQPFYGELEKCWEDAWTVAYSQYRDTISENPYLLRIRFS